MKVLYFLPIILLCLSIQLSFAQESATLGVQGSLSYGGNNPHINHQFGLTGYIPLTSKWGFIPEIGVKADVDYFYFTSLPPIIYWAKTNSLQLKLIGTYRLSNDQKATIPRVFCSLGYSFEYDLSQSYSLTGSDFGSSVWDFYRNGSRHDIFLGVGIRQKIGKSVLIVLRPEASPFFFVFGKYYGALRLNLSVSYVR